MFRPSVGVRWWLGAAFAVVAATSTAIVVSQFSDSSEHAFRHNAENVALNAVRHADHARPASLARVGKQQNVELRVY
jgi:integral membrane sensor domain MASE1